MGVICFVRRNYWWMVVLLLIVLGDPEAWYWYPIGLITFLGAIGIPLYYLWGNQLADREQERIEESKRKREVPYIQVQTAR